VLPLTPATTAEATVQSGDATVKCAAMKPIAANSTAVESAKSAAMKSAAMKSAAMKSAAAVETPSASVRCVGDTRLAKNGRAQQRSCNTRRRPSLPGPGSAIG
jgi:hypothetical protein